MSALLLIIMVLLNQSHMYRKKKRQSHLPIFFFFFLKFSLQNLGKSPKSLHTTSEWMKSNCHSFIVPSFPLSLEVFTIPYRSPFPNFPLLLIIINHWCVVPVCDTDHIHDIGYLYKTVALLEKLLGTTVRMKTEIIRPIKFDKPYGGSLNYYTRAMHLH